LPRNRFGSPSENIKGTKLKRNLKFNENLEYDAEIFIQTKTAVCFIKINKNMALLWQSDEKSAGLSIKIIGRNSFNAF